MLKNMLQKVFNFGLQDKKIKENETAFKEESSKASQKKHETLSECRSLLSTAQNQRVEKNVTEALVTLEKIIEIMEREEL